MKLITKNYNTMQEFLIKYGFICWYLLGLIGGLIIAWKYDKDISLGDTVVCFTLYGAGGPIAIGIGIYYLYKARRVYKKYGIKI